MTILHPNSTLRFILRWLIILASVSFVVGLAGAAFLRSLTWVSATFTTHHWLIFLLPIFGLLSVWAYETFAPSSAGGVKTLINQIKHPTAILPVAKGPMIFGTTLLSHLGGASVGREGTALQLGASLADQFNRIFKLMETERQTLLLCGVSAGFSAVFGTPLAAAVFAIEFVKFRSHIQYSACLCTAYAADYIGRNLGGSVHADYSVFFPFAVGISWGGALWAAAIGLACGLVARTYLWSFRKQTEAVRRIHSPYLRILLGALLFILIVAPTDSYEFTGLGLSGIDAAFEQNLGHGVWIFKMILTLICVGFGFRGGEVTPLFFIGAALGTALAPLTGLAPVVCAGLGFVGVFAGVGAVPLACSIMAYELFHPSMGGYALVACSISWVVAGRRGLYEHEG